jgi:putative flippase GtrA
VITQFLKYCVVGASNTLITLVTYLVLVAFGADYLLASALGYALGSINSYALNYHWTFELRRADHRRTLSRFAVVQGFGIGSNLGLIYLFVDDLAFAKAPAQFPVTLIVLAATFAMNRLWAFCLPASSVAQLDRARPAV